MPERQAWLMPAAVIAVAVACWWAYNHTGRALAEIAVVPYALLLVVAPSLIYPAVRNTGTGAAAVCASLLLPLLWLAKEMHRVTAVFRPAEALYYALNPLSLGIFCAAALQMALAELLHRRRRDGAWRISGWPAAVLGGIGCLALAAWWLGRESGGRDLFYGYIAIHRALFPEG